TGLGFGYCLSLVTFAVFAFATHLLLLLLSYCTIFGSNCYSILAGVDHSPDGNLIAYESNGDDIGLCIYSFIDVTTTCTLFDEARSGYHPVELCRPSVLIWSPDSCFVAFTGNHFL